MYTITRKDFEKLKREHPDYVSKAIMKHEHNGNVCNIGDYTCFECLLSNQSGTGLIFEHIHFEII